MKTNDSEEKISNSNQLKINEYDIGMGWKEENYQYMSDPVEFLEDFVDQIDEIAFNPNGAKKDKERLLKMATKLKESNVKDSSTLQLRKLDNDITTSFIEIDTFVFNANEGAKNYFDYMNNKKDDSVVLNIGNKATTFSKKYSNNCSYLFQFSNVFIKVIDYMGGNEGRIIVDKIMGKTQK